MNAHHKAHLGDLSSGLGEAGTEADRDEILSRFLSYTSSLGLELYPAQEEAILELLAYKHVILNTPTGSGKSLVAKALHFQAMCEGRSSFYTAPTKALVNEKFFDLCDTFGPEKVGLLTGDASVNHNAPIICCTAEILSNQALCSDEVNVDYVIMDEFHYYGDPERGIAWQIPLISMHDTVFLLMSATLGDTFEIVQRLESFTERKAAVIRAAHRPVPLEFEYRETPLTETIQDLVQKSQAPIYLVHFTQRDCSEQAQNLTSISVCSKEDRQSIAREIAQFRFQTPYGKEFSRIIRQGVGVHHAGLLPRYRRIVERLSQTGLIKVISGTDTLGVGVNIPIRTVLFSQLYKYDGTKIKLLTARAFHQIAGRAGRKGFDDKGFVVVQAPEWIIENQRMKAKVASNPNLKKKMVLKKQPARSIPWDKAQFQKLTNSPPEPLVPQFNVTHGMLVHLLRGDPNTPSGGYRRLIELIGRSHGTQLEKKHQRRRAALLFRTLVEAEIVQLIRDDQKKQTRVRVREDLQTDFSLNHTLSLFLVDTLEKLDPNSESYALDLLSLVESIQDDPKFILLRQLDKLKTELMAKLKAEGVEYEKRIEALEQVEYPKPKADFIYDSFNAFSKKHPWVSGENIKPKSIARMMYENWSGFNDYIKEFGLARSEGVLLRYLSQVYKTAVQNVPESYWTVELEEILAYLHTLVRCTDSSLIEEWEQMFAPDQTSPTLESTFQPPPATDPFRALARNRRAFTARIRTELHLLLKSLGNKDYEAACLAIYTHGDILWTPERMEQEIAPYYAQHAFIDLTPRARLAEYTIVIEETPDIWSARQRIIDPEGEEDWTIYCVIDLSKTREPSEPLIELDRIGT